MLLYLRSPDLHTGRHRRPQQVFHQAITECPEMREDAVRLGGQ